MVVAREIISRNSTEQEEEEEEAGKIPLKES